MEYEHLIPFAKTKRQQQILEAVINLGSHKKASDELSIKESGVEKSLARIRKNYKKSLGLDSDYVGATSTLIKGNEDDDFALRWIKAKDNERIQNQQIALNAFREKLPKAKPVKINKGTNNKALINMYVITDYHLGMLSWGEETGAEWNTDFAVETLIKWFQVAIEKAPLAEQCLFLENGDFEHYDGLDSVTPMNKHVLDSDTRQHKLIRASIQVNKAVIEMLLKKYKKVNVVIAEGNHNLSSSAWRREAFNMFYQNEPRVFIDTEVKPYYAFKHGLTALFFSHGHVKKMPDIDRTFTGMFPEIFGQTKYRYAHMGHFHTDHLKETNLMKIEQHRTLAAPDAYAVRHGYLSGRDAKVITYHKDFGEVSRLIIGFDML